MKYEISVVDNQGEEKVISALASDPMLALQRIHADMQFGRRLKPNQYKIVDISLTYFESETIGSKPTKIVSHYPLPGGPNPDLTSAETFRD